LVGRFIPFLKSNRNSDRQFSASIKSITGYVPLNPEVYRLALMHSSKSKKTEFSVNNNERLEFLGDAVLGAIIGEYVFKKFPNKDEGFLTQLRSKLVNRKQLNQLALKFGIDKILKSNLPQKEKMASSACGDAFEALIGAMYLDLGYEKTKKFIIQKLLKYHVDVTDLVNSETDFKSKLQIYSQKNKLELKYHCEEFNDRTGKKSYRVYVNLGNDSFESFEHHSKRAAEQKAAEIALLKIEHG
jgi:ribonuclease-3